MYYVSRLPLLVTPSHQHLAKTIENSNTSFPQHWENGFLRVKNVEMKIRTLANTELAPSKTEVKTIRCSAPSIIQNHFC